MTRQQDHSATATGSTEDYEAVIFDLDGVLLQDAATPASVYEDAADTVIDWFDLDVTDDQRRTLRKYHYDDELAACCRDIGVDPEAFWGARERFASRIGNRRIHDGARRPYPDTDVLAGLAPVLAIVSNNRQATVTFVAQHLFDGQFAAATGRDRTIAGYGRKKPNSYYLDQTLADLGVERALYVGDRESDVVAAHRAGIDSAFLRREHNSATTLEEPPTYDIDSLSALPAILDGETETGAVAGLDGEDEVDE